MPIALVTGASRGIGRAIALRLADRGVDIAGVYRTNAREAEAVAALVRDKGRRAAMLQLDVASTTDFPAFADRFGASLSRDFGATRFDFLVNNAGVGSHAPFMETSEAEFDALANIHFKGVFFLTQRLAPMMNDGGAILNLSSGLARFSMPGYAAYGAMKGAIDTLTRYMAAELAPRRIRVNSLAPGAIETDFGGGAVRDNADLNRMIAGMTALGRVGAPDDIGLCAAALLLEEGRWINGQRIEASGGIFL